MSIITHKNTACKRLRAVGLTQSEALSILDQVNIWNKSNGADWTISRIKDLKTAFIHRLAGYEDIWSSTPWIAHKKFSPKGAFSPIFSRLSNKPQKALSALMVYTEYVSNKVTKAQWTKFINGVESPKVDETELFRIRRVSNHVKKFIKPNIVAYKHSVERFDRPEQWYLKDTYAPYYSNRLVDGEIETSTKSKKLDLNVFVESLTHPLVQGIIGSDLSHYKSRYSYRDYIESYKEFKSTSEDYSNIIDTAIFQGEEEDIPEVMGRIGFIQEPGGKLRSVANPFPGLQFISSKLGNTLYKILESLPNDYTHNQDGAVKALQDFWKDNPGTEIMSIDLSSATDLFPLDFQLDMLEHIGIDHGSLYLFEAISRGKWELPSKIQKDFGKQYVSWTRGQPLGLYPSFAAFALSHNMLAMSTKPKFYAIVGDDIIIDAKAGRLMRDLYTELGCKVSEGKSIHSAQLAEFTGKLITKDKTYIQPKWKRVSDHNFIELAKRLGPKSLGMFRPRQKKLLQILDVIPKELSPFGLGWNTLGLPYSKRIEIFNKFKLSLKDEVTTLVSQINLDNEALRRSLEWGQFTDFHNLNVKPRKIIDRDNLSFEDLLLEFLAIHRIESDVNILHESFVKDCEIRVSDPRGKSTLQILEESLDIDEDLESFRFGPVKASTASSRKSRTRQR